MPPPGTTPVLAWEGPCKRRATAVGAAGLPAGPRQLAGARRVVEQDETMEQAVVREVEEEAGVTAKVEGVLGIRNRCDEDSGNSMYVVMLLSPVSGAPQPDLKEVDQAGYFTMQEIEELEQVPPVNIEIAKRALDANHRLLSPRTVTQVGRGDYTLFVG